MVKLAPTSLSDVSTLTQLASTLQVDVKALHLVRISSDFCRSPSCNLPSCEGNNRYCILCSQTWFPVPSKSISRNSRGHGLYGPEYMRLYNGVLQKKACCCDMPLCEKIGYSHSGMFRLPADNTHRTQAINALGIQTLALRDDLHSNHRSHRLAPWHFHPNHLEMGEDGTWRFKKMPAYFDQENKKFAFPPPNASLRLYIESIKSNEYSRGGYDDTLPVWARKFIRTALTTIAATPAPPSSQPQPIATPLPSSTARTANTSTARAPISGLKAQRLNFTASAPRARTKRNSPEAQQIEELEDAARLIQLQLDEKVGELNACLEAQKQLKLTVEAMGSEMIQIKIENAKLKGEIASLTS